MRSFKEYEKVEEVVKERVGKENAASAEELTKRIAAAYEGKSNLAMLRSILQEAERSKRAGTLSNEEIESFYKQFSPMLNGFQRRQLRDVVERLKKI